MSFKVRNRRARGGPPASVERGLKNKECNSLDNRHIPHGYGMMENRERGTNHRLRSTTEPVIAIAMMAPALGGGQHERNTNRTEGYIVQLQPDCTGSHCYQTNLMWLSTLLALPSPMVLIV